MPIIQTPKELGLAIRSRRKELGWDQATLAKQVGVTRQWVIEIEKGKPRAELGLALRALRVLGLSLNVDAKEGANTARGSEGREHQASEAPPNLDINAIVERNRGAATNRSAVLPSAIADYMKEMETARQLDSLANLGIGRSAAELLGSDTLANQLSELTNPGLPKTAADYLKELESARSLDSLAGLDTSRSAADVLGGNTWSSRLSELVNPQLPKTAADYLKELEAERRLGSLTDFDAITRGFDPLGEATAASRLADLAFPKLPRTIADELKEIEAARRLDRLTGVVRPADDSLGTLVGPGGATGKRKPGSPAKDKRVSKPSGSKR